MFFLLKQVQVGLRKSPLVCKPILQAFVGYPVILRKWAPPFHILYVLAY